MAKLSKLELINFLVNSDFEIGADYAAHMAGAYCDEIERRLGYNPQGPGITVRTHLEHFYTLHSYAWLLDRYKQTIEHKRAMDFVAQ
jgi:hypothetical protein